MKNKERNAIVHKIGVLSDDIQDYNNIVGTISVARIKGIIDTYGMGMIHHKEMLEEIQAITNLNLNKLIPILPDMK